MISISMIIKRFSLLCAFVVCLMSVTFVSPAKADQGSIVLRPPFDGTFRTTVYFDHEYPNYAYGDGDVTIYDGEKSDDCAPYCYTGHNGTDWSMVVGI